VKARKEGQQARSDEVDPGKIEKQGLLHRKKNFWSSIYSRGLTKCNKNGEVPCGSLFTLAAKGKCLKEPTINIHRELFFPIPNFNLN